MQKSLKQVLQNTNLVSFISAVNVMEFLLARKQLFIAMLDLKDINCFFCINRKIDMKKNCISKYCIIYILIHNLNVLVFLIFNIFILLLRSSQECK
jgi:hypothetical protein